MATRKPDPGTDLVRTEVHTLTPAQLEVVKELPSIWGAQWTTLDKLKPAEIEMIGRQLLQAFPDWTAYEMSHYIYILGGKLVLSAEFWMHVATQHPEYDGCVLTVLEPGQPLWTEYMGKQDPAAIAVAIMCQATRRTAAGLERVEREASYVSATDPILNEYEWINAPAEIKTRRQAETWAAEQGILYDRISAKPVQNAPPGTNEIGLRICRPKPDAKALAYKKARTTATRRTLIRLFSLAEARVSSVLAPINKRLEAKLAPPETHHFGHVGEGQRRLPIGNTGLNVVLPAEDTPAIKEAPYGEEESRRTPRPAPTWKEGEPLRAESATPTAPRPLTVSEEDRKKLYRDLEGKDISSLVDAEIEGSHEALHTLIRRMKGLGPNEPVHTTELSYPEWEQLRGLIDALPPEPTAKNPAPFGDPEPPAGTGVV